MKYIYKILGLVLFVIQFAGVWDVNGMGAAGAGEPYRNDLGLLLDRFDRRIDEDGDCIMSDVFQKEAFFVDFRNRAENRGNFLVELVDGTSVDGLRELLANAIGCDSQNIRRIVAGDRVLDLERGDRFIDFDSIKHGGRISVTVR